MPDHELVNIIVSADAAINAEDLDALMTFYAEDATPVVGPGRWVTRQKALREAFVAIAEHFWHTEKRRAVRHASACNVRYRIPVDEGPSVLVR